MGSRSSKPEYTLPEPKIVEKKRLSEAQMERGPSAFTGETGEQAKERLMYGSSPKHPIMRALSSSKRRTTTTSLEEAKKPRTIYTYGGKTLLG